MWRQIFGTTLLAGTMDIVAACTQAYIQNSVSPHTVLKYVASGLFGEQAYQGGFAMALAGLLLHFTIAFACVAIFFALYPKFKVLHHKIALNALIIAIVAWSVTQLAIVPLSKIGPSAVGIKKMLAAMGILFLCIGLPIAYSAKRYYGKDRVGSQP